LKALFLAGQRFFFANVQAEHKFPSEISWLHPLFLLNICYFHQVNAQAN